MEELQKKGLTKSIGVSNFNKKQLDRLLENCTIPPVTNQVIVNQFIVKYSNHKPIQLIIKTMKKKFMSFNVRGRRYKFSTFVRYYNFYNLIYLLQ